MRRSLGNKRSRRLLNLVASFLMLALFVNLLILHERLQKETKSHPTLQRHPQKIQIDPRNEPRRGFRMAPTRFSIMLMNETASVLMRVKESLKERKKKCAKGDPKANQTFGLLASLESDTMSEFRCSIVSPTKNATYNSARTGGRTAIRLALIMTSQCENIHALFVQLLKWLCLNEYDDASMSTTNTKESRGLLRGMHHQSDLANKPFLLEQIWLLIPREKLGTLEEDQVYGSRLLEWNRQSHHPLRLSPGDTLWEAISNVRLSEGGVQTEPQDMVVWVDGDRQQQAFESSVPTKPLLWNSRQARVWLRQRQQYSNNEGIVLHEMIEYNALAQTSNRVDEPSLVCGERGWSRTTFLPHLHMSIIPWSLLCYLQYPALVSQMQNFTADWEVAQIGAALWLSWLSPRTILCEGSTRGNATSTNIDKEQAQALSSVMGYMGGVAPVHSVKPDDQLSGSNY